MTTAPSAQILAFRPYGYFLWGLGCLLLTFVVLGIGVWILLSPFEDSVRDADGAVLLAVPFCAWAFLIVPWSLISWALVGFALSRQAARGEHPNEPLAREVGSARTRVFAPRFESRATRVATAVGAVGAWPGWWYLLSSLVIVAAIMCVRVFADPVLVTMSGAALGLGIIGAVLGAGRRLRRVSRREWPNDHSAGVRGR